MINTIYRLSSPKFFEEYFMEETDFNKIVIRPKFLSICQADQRYYNGNRPAEVLNQKLPMALIHEAVGEVVFSKNVNFNVGDNVVMIPNTPIEDDSVILENYLSSSKFRSSGYDGFMSEYVFMGADRIVKLPSEINLEVASFIELISVAVHSINRFKLFSHDRRDVIGVWGDGSFGYIVSLILKFLFPNSEIYIFGVNNERLDLLAIDKNEMVLCIVLGIVIIGAFIYFYNPIFAITFAVFAVTVTPPLLKPFYHNVLLIAIHFRCYDELCD